MRTTMIGSRSPQDAEILAAIEAKGGRISRDEAAEGKPVVAVSFATAKIADADVALVQAIPTLTKLVLNNNKSLTDAALDPIPSMSSLRKLYLVETGITDTGLAKLKDHPSLEILSLVGTNVTDAAVPSLQAMPALKELFVAGTPISDEALRALKTARPNLKIDRLPPEPPPEPEPNPEPEKKDGH
ncbi:hypothetical protein Isop_1339 [Isosphaera pallida ATCC 43644]|uniref:Uncharacterized protein n=1 Tax=Isosphaera pallida (strain ATCC 43644 / DSM 9630 / IS1B) TaxID=575540 RepID=E8QWN2_ISOPI|nr:hypothetical protein [Isosphaera pallida]ADV61924.1 hypothetical protein Isop_1339 [Isosphaera pallida ATCC 43644]